MFRFAEPYYLYALLLIPTLIVLFVVYRRAQKRRLAKFGDLAIIAQLMPEASPKRVRNKFILLLIVVGLMVVALAQPQFGAKLREVKRKGIEIMLAVDVSKSMLAEDFKPNRLERTKYAASRLVEQLEDDRVGMIVFAGDAFIQLPITSDYVSARGFINSVSTDIVPVQGTSIAKAIELATRSYSENSNKSRALVIISDGESHDDDPVAAAQQAKESGIIIYTVGIGTPEGAPISINGEMMKDEEGNMVVSKLDEQTLQQLAVLTGGTYVRATNQSVGLDEILKRIKAMEKQEFNALAFAEYNDQFHYLVALALLILLIEFIMLDRKNRILSKISIFK
ncbi:BatB [Mucinivorans hirudinis]|uniref:BatB n=1 Tax=Mucinivorans hirudinis TaxID=1433126 RepID=A0A060RA33_9BACT|nr:BatB [Mucinivorans hirudinis]